MIRTPQPHLPVVAQTHPGRRGKKNEDRYGVFSYLGRPDGSTPVLLAVLADGIGGHRAGEVAAEMAVEHIGRYAEESDGIVPERVLEEAIEAASNAIYERAQSHPAEQGMGSTCACAWIAGSRLYTATVGDSRIYLLRGSYVQQISIDHTWVQEALEQDLIKPEQVAGHPNLHAIRRYLGSPTPPQVDFRLRLTDQQGAIQAVQNQGLALQADDVVLLCSDGLSDLVKAEEMLAAFRRNRRVEGAARELIDLANERGGHDNITLIAISVPAEAVAEAGVTTPVPARRGGTARSLAAGCLGAALLLIALAALVGGLWRLQEIRAGQETATPTKMITLVAPGVQATLRSPTPDLTPLPSQTGSAPAATRPAGQATITPWPTNTPDGDL